MGPRHEKQGVGTCVLDFSVKKGSIALKRGVVFQRSAASILEDDGVPSFPEMVSLVILSCQWSFKPALFFVHSPMEIVLPFLLGSSQFRNHPGHLVQIRVTVADKKDVLMHNGSSHGPTRGMGKNFIIKSSMIVKGSNGSGDSRKGLGGLSTEPLGPLDPRIQNIGSFSKVADIMPIIDGM